MGISRSSLLSVFSEKGGITFQHLGGSEAGGDETGTDGVDGNVFSL